MYIKSLLTFFVDNFVYPLIMSMTIFVLNPDGNEIIAEEKFLKHYLLTKKKGLNQTKICFAIRKRRLCPKGIG